MYMSTSHQYPVIAFCDVVAAMMEPPGGPSMVEDFILGTLDFMPCHAMREVDAEPEKSSRFQVWGPVELLDDDI